MTEVAQLLQPQSILQQPEIMKWIHDTRRQFSSSNLSPVENDTSRSAELGGGLITAEIFTQMPL